MEHRLRGDAADIEAGAAELVALLDDGGLQAKLAATDRAVVPAGTGADDDDVVALAHEMSASDRSGASYTRLARRVNKGNMVGDFARIYVEN